MITNCNCVGSATSARMRFQDMWRPFVPNYLHKFMNMQLPHVISTLDSSVIIRQLLMVTPVVVVSHISP